MLTLVTGTTGQVGRRFVPRLLGQRQPGEQVRVLVRDAARGERFAELGAQVAVGDMRDEETLGKALAGVDAVVNVAASFRGVPDEEAWAVNRDAAVALGRAAQAVGVERFVQVSTNNVYGLGRGRPLTEEDESRPGGAMWGAYPESKAEAERELLALKGLDVRIGRLPFLFRRCADGVLTSSSWPSSWLAASWRPPSSGTRAVRAPRPLPLAPLGMTWRRPIPPRRVSGPSAQEVTTRRGGRRAGEGPLRGRNDFLHMTKPAPGVGPTLDTRPIVPR
ncbi:NAD-dependent epimerase/dehydratase family protein [Streptomyces bungoensis]|uniref:NAD-dependent epimerase/dehydratase family protein n=1 Tax=Streptomyces bungoensis TaxID=285568 RepID=UPI000A4025B4|nr:NAD(P)H-binding protein [Streptomyces bungoensis]